MNKSLEALEEMKGVLISNPGTKRYYDIFENHWLKDIETALIELEDLQQVLDDFGIHNTMNLIDTLKNIQLLEKRNAIDSKKLKAFEIIKENVYLDELGNIMPRNQSKTQEEFNLLKEYFK